MKYQPTKLKPADCLIKALDCVKHLYFDKMIGLENSGELDL